MNRIDLQRKELPVSITRIFKRMLNGMIHPSIAAQIAHGVFLAVRLIIFIAWCTMPIFFSSGMLDMTYCGIINGVFLVLNIVLTHLDFSLKDLLGMLNPLTLFIKNYFMVTSSVSNLKEELKGYSCSQYIPELRTESPETIDILFGSLEAFNHLLYVQELINPVNPEEKVFFIIDSLLTKPLYIVRDESTGDIHVYKI